MDPIDRLRKYAEGLQRLVAQEEEALRMIGLPKPNGEGFISESANATFRAMREPVSRTIVAYKRSLGNLYKLFPEIKPIDDARQP